MTHYTCDRCGVDIPWAGREVACEVQIEWPDVNGVGTVRESIWLRFSVHQSRRDNDKPDLCEDCYAHILHEVASTLDTDREPVLIGGAK